MQALRERIERVASTDFTVLIEGESGTGKELVARQIHEISRRRAGPFVAVNCAALVETLLEAELFGIEERTATGVRGRRGKFEHADGGTLFLDEVSDLSLSAQAKLLRAIQDLAVERVGGHGSRRVNTRIVAATNRRLAGMVARGMFRTDLYYRLERSGDPRAAAAASARATSSSWRIYFLDAAPADARPVELSACGGDALLMYDWPGNVRELERFIERAVALAESNVIQLDDLPPQSARRLRRDAWRRRSRRRYDARVGQPLCAARVRAVRAATSGAHAGHLDISYHTLQSYLRYRPLEGSAQGGAAEPTGACATTAEAEGGRHSSMGG